MTFWDRYHELCTQNGKSANAVALELGFSNATCTKWKKGSEPGSKSVSKIADYFGVTADYLLGTEHKPTVETLSSLASANFTVEPVPVGFVRVPVIGKVAAGTQCTADMEIEEYIACDSSMINDSYEYCYLKVTGDSMEPLIRENDLVLVRIQSDVDSGSYAVVLVDDEDGLVKRVEKDAEQITLISENPYYPPRRFEKENMNRIRIFGLVVETRRRFV